MKYADTAASEKVSCKYYMYDVYYVVYVNPHKQSCHDWNCTRSATISLETNTLVINIPVFIFIFI